MTTVKRFQIEEVAFAGENGETLYYVTDGVISKGGYKSRQEAEKKIEDYAWDWGINS